MPDQKRLEGKDKYTVRKSIMAVNANLTVKDSLAAHAPRDEDRGSKAVSLTQGGWDSTIRKELTPFYFKACMAPKTLT